MSKFIDVVDQSDDRDGFLAEQREFHANAVLARSVPDMVRQVINRIGSQEIARLRIFGHGSFGRQAVGEGDSYDPQYVSDRAIYVNGKGKLIPRDILALLSGRFEPRGRCSCTGAKSPPAPADQSCSCYYPTCGRFASRPPPAQSTPTKTIFSRAHITSRPTEWPCK